MKRGPGGIVDIEFLVQMLQLQHARKNPRLRTPNTLSALAELHAAVLLDGEDYRFFDAQYRFLRTIEGRLRLLNSTARDTLPHDATELNKLAHLLKYPGSDALMADYDGATREIRRRFERMLEAAAAAQGIGTWLSSGLWSLTEKPAGQASIDGCSPTAV